MRVAGPFTVESLSPHRVVPADEEELLDVQNAAAGKRRRSKLVTPPTDFAAMVLEHLRTAGVHQSEKKDAIKFTSLQGWPGEYIGAEGVFAEGQTQRRAGIFLGPEFGTVSRVDLVAAAARGDRGALRRADRLRLQFRRPCLRAVQARPAADPQGQDEPRPAHGGRAEEHRQGQSLRRVRRARHRHRRPRRTARSACR